MMIRLITTTVVNPVAAAVFGLNDPETPASSTTIQDISVAQADTVLGALGLTMISESTLESFVERSPGNRLSVLHGATIYTFAPVPADER